MPRKKKSETDEELDASTMDEEIDKIQLCKIADVSNGKLHFYFDGYGVQLNIPNGNKDYSIGDSIKVGYSGVIGTYNFKKWIVG